MKAHSYFEEYLSNITSNELIDTIRESVSNFHNKISLFQKEQHINGLLLGNVQSGKTSQMLGIISKMADMGYNFFILLTTDNVYLQKQTKRRVEQSFNNFLILGEHEELELLKHNFDKPVVIVLKKNSRILKKWYNILSGKVKCKKIPFVFFDDEADAASLNTKVNSRTFSAINRCLNDIKAISDKSIYIQVTATPQAVLLQSLESNWKPSFVVYFKPGEKYLGGNFFYSDPQSYCIKFTEENELEEVKNNENYISSGLRESLYSFLITAASFYLSGINVCNFIIHPSVKINDHNEFATKIAEHLNLLLNSFDDEEFQNGLKESWKDLQSTKPDLQSFEEIFLAIKTILSEQLVKPLILNSKTPININYNSGYNIIAGGNTLGRGITLPRLQTVYYCRRAKTPQADTYWQHSRIFGYDRDQGLVRIFIPKSLYHLFLSLNNSNKNIINQISEHGLKGIQILLPPHIKPTRSNVLNKDIINVVSGGVNYFPLYPSEIENPILDEELKDFSENEDFHEVNIDIIIKILQNLHQPEDFPLSKFISCVISMRENKPSIKCKLIVRRNRNIGKYTGTLLSETDRKLGDRFNKEIVLTMYKITGSKEKGWQGKPFWIPNIKLPEEICYYDIK